MSYVYRKVRVIESSNGALRQRGVLARDSRGTFVYLTPEANRLEGSRICRLGNLDFNSLVLEAADPTLSFVSFIRMIEAGEHWSDSFPEARLHLDGETFTVTALSDINFDFLSTPSVSDTEIAIKSGYTQNDIYCGMGGYHSNQSNHRFNSAVTPDKPWRIGVELELYARDNSSYRTIIGARSNWFQCERDGSLTEGDYAIEMKTIPLKACDAKSVDFWDAPMTKLKTLAKSKGFRTTGLHVHIGKEIFGSTEIQRQQNLAKLNLFYVYLVESDPAAHAKNVAICGREQGYAGDLSHAKSDVGDIVMTSNDRKGMFTSLSEAGKTALVKNVNDKARSQRWDINLGCYNSYGTVEFRKGKGIISKTRMAALITWWEQMILYCNETPWEELSFDAFFRKVCNENPCVAYFFNQDEEC